MTAVRKFFPKFDERYKIVAFNTSIKTMVSSSSSSRPLVVVNDVDVHPFFFTVFSAKLSTVFSCAEAAFLGMVRAVENAQPDGESILEASDEDTSTKSRTMSWERTTPANNDRDTGMSRMRSVRNLLKREASQKEINNYPAYDKTTVHKCHSNAIERGRSSKSITLASFENDMFSIFAAGDAMSSSSLSFSDEEESVDTMDDP
jgi:hypothetical protein